MKSSSASFLFLARLFMGVIFTYAGFTKLLEPMGNFRGAIADYEVFPYAIVPLIAYVLPWIEFVFGIFMLIGYAPRISALVLALLSFGFMIVLGSSNALLESSGKD